VKAEGKRTKTNNLSFWKILFNPTSPYRCSNKPHKYLKCRSRWT